jgi:hypothetical protein
LVAVVLIGGYATFMNAQGRPEFDVLDADRSGYLEPADLVAVTLPAGTDANGDGRISWPEYRSGAR